MSKEERAPRPPQFPKPELPATYEMALVDTVAEAIGRIEHLLAGPACDWLAAALRERLRRGLTDRRKVIEAAHAGDDLSHEVLMAEFHDLLDDGVMPPASLREYAAQRDKHPKRGKGRVWHDDWRRNYGFCFVIAFAAGLGLEVTRSGRDGNAPCATSVASLALRRCGFKRGTSESRLANLWGKLGDIAIDCIVVQRTWPEVGPYLGMSGDPANIDWQAVMGGPSHRNLLP